MLKYHTIDISCRAIPEEVSLLLNITGCTIKCPGCNEKTLWKDKGTALTFNELRDILKNYNSAITCVCFMGGEHEPSYINDLARLTRQLYPCLHTAWYSGLPNIPNEIEYCNFNYLKTGAYEASKGVLGEQGTNQRVFMVADDCSLSDITDRYIRTEPDEVRKLEETAQEITEEPELPENVAEEETEVIGTEEPQIDNEIPKAHPLTEDTPEFTELQELTPESSSSPEPEVQSGIIMEI